MNTSRPWFDHNKLYTDVLTGKVYKYTEVRDGLLVTQLVD